MKKELSKWLNFKVSNNICLLTSIVFVWSYFFEKNLILLLIGVFLFIFSIIFAERKYLFVLVFAGSLFTFILFFGLSTLGLKDGAEIDGIARVTEAKDNYYIIKWQHSSFYLSRSDKMNFIVGEKINFNGQISKMASNSNYFEFDFSEYLNKKFIFYEIKMDDFTSSYDRSFQFILNNWIKNLGFSSLTNVFLFGDTSKQNQVYSLLLDVNLTYLKNAPIFLIVSLLYWINTRKKKSKSLIYFQVLILVFLAMFSLVYINKVLIYRVIIFWTLKLKFSYKSNKILNIQCLIVLIIIDPSYAFSQGFLYLFFIFIFIAYLPNYKISKKSAVAFGFYLLFLMLQAYSNYSLGFTNSIYALLLAPIINAYTLLAFFSDLFHMKFVFFLDSSLITILNFIKKFNLIYNVGHIDIWFVVLWIAFALQVSYWGTFSWKIIAGWFLLLFFSCLLVFLIRPPANLVMLNVGNANSFVYHDKWQNVTIVFDAGTGKGKSTNLVSDYLTYIGVNKVDIVFISHFDSDHYNNFFSLQEKFKINEVVTNENFKSSYQIKNIILNVFNNPYAKTDNDASLIIIMDVGQFRALFMGDAEKPTESYLLNRLDFKYLINLKRIDFMQISHHGSKTSSSEEFIKFVNPKHAFISGTNEGGNKNFPHKETIATLKKLKINYFITASVDNWFYFLKTGKITKK